MYTIETTQENGIYKATLLYKHRLMLTRQERDFKQHADFAMLYDEIKSWKKYLKLNK